MQAYFVKIPILSHTFHSIQMHKKQISSKSQLFPLKLHSINIQ